MCTLCNDWASQKIDSDELITKLFKMKEQLGRKHVSFIMKGLDAKMTPWDDDAPEGAILITKKDKSLWTLHPDENGNILLLSSQENADMMDEISSWTEQSDVLN